jgi:hypothetical protein
VQPVRRCRKVVSLRYLLIGWSGDDRPVALPRANGPEAPLLRNITTSHGIEHLGARIAAFVVLE